MASVIMSAMTRQKTQFDKIREDQQLHQTCAIQKMDARSCCDVVGVESEAHLGNLRHVLQSWPWPWVQQPLVAF